MTRDHRDRGLEDNPPDGISAIARYQARNLGLGHILFSISRRVMRGPLTGTQYLRDLPRAFKKCRKGDVKVTNIITQHSTFGETYVHSIMCSPTASWLQSSRLSSLICTMSWYAWLAKCSLLTYFDYFSTCQVIVVSTSPTLQPRQLIIKATKGPLCKARHRPPPPEANHCCVVPNEVCSCCVCYLWADADAG